MILIVAILKDRHGHQYVARLAKWPIMEIIGRWDNRLKVFYPDTYLTERDLLGIVNQLKKMQ
jgi:hypothetical protein